MKNKISFFGVLAGVLLFIGVVTLFFRIYSDSKHTPILTREIFANEFKGAYEKEVEKSRNIKEIDMIASEGEVEIFEGIKTKIWNYNNSVPAPEIRINLGDTLKLNFKNKLPQETTVHFHGVRVPNAMDGVPGVTQDPIKTGDTFVYEFTPKDAGTFWFHPHVKTSEQMEKGLYGVLVVEDEYTKKYSQDKVWVIDDWRLQNDYQIDPRFVTSHDLMHDGRWGNVITVNGLLQEKLIVRPGERIRLRFVNTSNARIYAFDFGDLEVNTIAVDGMYVKKVFSANGFEIAPGNRIDVDITIPKDSDLDTFVINDIFTRNTNPLGQIIVQGDEVETPQFDFPTNKNIPDWEDAINISADKEYRLSARRSSTGDMGMMGGIEWTINDKAFPEYDPFKLKYDEFNKIRFVNESSRLHPMHLHGQFFKVISRDEKPVNEPYFRDTVLIHPQEIVEIGIVPLDKGDWVNHCHILEHADAGMLTIITVQ